MSIHQIFNLSNPVYLKWGTWKLNFWAVPTGPVFYSSYTYKHNIRGSVHSLPLPRLTPGPLIFFVKIPAPGTAFQCKTLAPGSKKGNKIPTPEHNLRSSNSKISMKKEHKSSFFPKFPKLSVWRFSFILKMKYSQVVIQQLRLIPQWCNRLKTSSKIIVTTESRSIPQWLCWHVLYTSFWGFSQTKHAAYFMFRTLFMSCIWRWKYLGRWNVSKVYLSINSWVYRNWNAFIYNILEEGLRKDTEAWICKEKIDHMANLWA